MPTGDVGMTASFLPFSSCWLSLEGGLLYAFVGPAAVIVLVRAPVSVQGGRWPQGVIVSFCLLPDLQLPPGGVLAPRAPRDPLLSCSAPPGHPGEHAHRNHRLQQAHGSRWRVRQI